VATITPATTYSATGLLYATNHRMRVTAQTAAGNGTPATVDMTTNAPNFLFSDVTATPLTGHSLRKLKSTYAGAAIKVRRSSDNTTQDIGFIGNGEPDQTALLAFVRAGDGFVDTWYDQTGGGKNWTQATLANQPIIATAGVVNKANGKPAVLFSATRWLLGAALGLYAAGVATMLGVFHGLPTGGVASQAVLVESASATQGRYVPAYITSAGAPATLIVNDAGTSVISGVGAVIAGNSTLHQISVTDDGSHIAQWANGAVNLASATYTRSALTPSRTVVGGLITGAGVTPSASFTGSIAELVAFASVLSIGNRQAGEANQKIEFATP
jgi:hypothetical protein